MPTLWSHRAYWAASDTAVAPVRISRGGYPGWQQTQQRAVFLASVFGALQALYDRVRERLRLWWRLTLRIERLSLDRRALILYTLETIDRPAYVEAQHAVKATATTLGFNRPEAWKGLSHAIKRDPGQAENTFRHLNACEILDRESRAHGSTLSNPERHFLVELAYQDYGLKSR